MVHNRGNAPNYSSNFPEATWGSALTSPNTESSPSAFVQSDDSWISSVHMSRSSHWSSYLASGEGSSEESCDIWGGAEHNMMPVDRWAGGNLLFNMESSELKTACRLWSIQTPPFLYQRRDCWSPSDSSDVTCCSISHHICDTFQDPVHTAKQYNYFLLAPPIISLSLICRFINLIFSADTGCMLPPTLLKW